MPTRKKKRKYKPRPLAQFFVPSSIIDRMEECWRCGVRFYWREKKDGSMRVAWEVDNNRPHWEQCKMGRPEDDDAGSNAAR